MILKPLKLVLVSTPIGYLGSGKGGGVELTVISLIKGLVSLGHHVTLVAPQGSFLPSDCSEVEIRHVSGNDQPSWQHQDSLAPITIPLDGLLPGLWDVALELGKKSDAVLNFGYDWLPIWLSKHVSSDIFHLISMGGVSEAMKILIRDVANSDNSRFAFHTNRQAEDYELDRPPIIVGNGFDLNNYLFQPSGGGPLGWAGRVAPEKGLEDAVEIASSLGEKLIVWGLIENIEYASQVEDLYPNGIIDWRGFLPSNEFQAELGLCRTLINTPKWNEAYGNVIVEAMACGVPVVAYDRGGPGEIIKSGLTGWIVPPDDVSSMKQALKKVDKIDRRNCRKWVEEFASKEVFAKKVSDWIINSISYK